MRQPAALCGVVGLKPTYGRISRYGLIAFASSLDTVGTFTRSVRDAATLLGAMAGQDPRDATSLDAAASTTTSTGLDGGVAGLRVGVIKESFGEGVEPGVRDALRASIARLEALGATCGGGLAAARRLRAQRLLPDRAGGGSSNLARYDGVRYGHRRRTGDDSSR